MADHYWETILAIMSLARVTAPATVLDSKLEILVFCCQRNEGNNYLNVNCVPYHWVFLYKLGKSNFL